MRHSRCLSSGGSHPCCSDYRRQFHAVQQRPLGTPSALPWLFGPETGGSFLAFPAIFFASATLIEKHERAWSYALTSRTDLRAILWGRRENIGMQQFQPFARPANQDRRHFPLGTSTKRPARGYWAARAGLSNDYQVEEAIAGLSDPQEIRAALIELAGYDFARDYMLYFKMDWAW
jgi:hypothetical protein